MMFHPEKMSAFHRSAEHRFLVLRKLGQGTYGKVQLAINKETNQEVAIKTIKKAKIESEEDMLRIRREIQILTSIWHPHIIHINEVFETKQKIVLVMQYASGGELYDYLGCHRTLPEVEARRIFRQIASAIYFCHKNKICHRDLKLENILLDDEGNAQIADFGLSNMFDSRRRMNTFCGSPLYASPEIVTGTPYEGPEVDCWSLGVLLYTLIYGTMPFDGKNFKELVTRISEGRYEEPINKSSASALIRRLLTPDISKRATIFDVCIDSWMNQGYAEPLVNIAERMVLEAALQTKKLEVTRKSSESTNDNKKKAIRNHETNFKGEPVPANKSPKAFLFDQILNYDVKFVINKLLAAVEAAGPTLNVPPKNNISTNENTISTFKPWPKNGDNGFVKKVDSAYVIPIFDVTSVKPQVLVKNTKNKNSEILRFSQNSQINETPLLANIEMNKPKTKKKIPAKSKELLSIPNGHTEQDLDKPNVKNNVRKEISRERIPYEATLPGIPSMKKKAHLLGPKKINSLTLAHIFSLKYEKLFLDALKLPERKQKVPGKITLPAPFDPSISANPTAPQRQAIVLPSVNVSENKHKIEVKIDKIHKAALNRNLILRSNTYNRLRIQKFLKAQVKKDLISDEQRCINGQAGGFPNISESFFYSFDKENYLNTKLYNKKIIFGNSNFNNAIHPFACNISRAEKWKFFGSENILMEPKQNLPHFGISKSKSDVQFHDNYTYFNSCDSRSYSSGYNSLSNTLSVPSSDCSLLRSASDSDGLNFCKNMPNFRMNKEEIKSLEENTPDILSETENFDQTYNGSLSKTMQVETPQHSLKIVQDFIHADYEHMRSKEDLNIGTQFGIRRSNSASCCKNSQTISAKDLQTIKLLLLSPIRNKADTEHGIPKSSFSSNALEHRQISEAKQLSNTFNEVPKCYDGKTYTSWNDTNVKNGNSFQHYSWLPQDDQRLLTALHKENGKCLSFPDLRLISLEKNVPLKIDFGIGIHNSKAISNNEDFDYVSQNTLQFSSQKLQHKYKLPNCDDIKEDFPQRNKAKSIGDLIESMGTQNGRQLSLPMGKSPFLSKFLNDLEKRESNILVNSFNQRLYPKNTVKSPKRSKLEKRSKSFLQLLALKRIQEAERELEKVDRNYRVEDEDDSGSLLEALKTHGYKGVISQRFQGTESDAMNSFYSRSSFLSRICKPDNTSYFNTNIDSLPYLHSPYEDDLDLEMLNAVRSAYEIYPSCRQNYPKQYIYDWLTTNQNGDYSSPFRTDSLFETEPESPTWGTNEGSSHQGSFDDTSPEYTEGQKDQYTNGTLSSNQTSEHCVEDSSNPSERNTLSRTTSEDEKEESVHDRIWRKSFYSRFNNSALSRKERASFVDVPESRSGTPLNSTLRDRRVSWNDSKRINTRKSSSSKVLGHLTKYLERTPTNTSVEMEETEQ